MRLIVIVSVFVFLSACSSHTVQAPVLNQNNPIQTGATSYLVKSNDTLYSIAWQSGKDVQVLAKLNNIAAPYTIRVGQKIQLVAKNGAISSQNKKNIYKKTPIKQKDKAVTSNKYKKTLKLKWQWPIKVRKLEKADSQQGLRLVGKTNELIRSGEDGKVVYAGNGLKGYGNLLIIKHNDEFLSAYGFNKRLLVKEGVFVKRGQAIAEIGLDFKKRPVLFFEIRRKGKPVSVKRYLPKI